MVGVVGNRTMNDLIYIGLAVGFFAAGALYIQFCEKLN